MIAILLITQTAWTPPVATGFDYKPGQMEFVRPVALFDQPERNTNSIPVLLPPVQVYSPGFT